MSTEYLIPQSFLNEIENVLGKGKKFIGSRCFKKYASPEFKKWCEERNIPSSIINYVFKNHLTKIVIPTCPVCGKELSFSQILEGNTFCSNKCLTTSKYVKEKRKKTCKEKYGVENPSQAKEVKEKKKQTSLEKYGVDNPFQAKEIKEKIKQTNFKKYGSEQYTQSDNYKENNRSKFWETFRSRLEEKKIVPLFSKEEYVKDTGRRFKCLFCAKEFTSDGLLKDNRYGTYTLNAHHICCPHCLRGVSKKEKDVVEFVKSFYNGEIIENDRTVLFEENKIGGQLELDIFLPSLNIAVEFNGTHWHSFNEAQERDVKKKLLCEERGIKLFVIKEGDWDNNRKEVEEKLKTFLLSA